MKILIVEDELALQNALKKGFEKKNYSIDIANDGNEAIDLFYTNLYDLIILDLNLPCLDGLEVLKIIREEDDKIKILILSARSEVDEKVFGLESGANDYLGKPFYFKELEARVAALLRRNFKTEQRLIIIDDVKINLSEKRVYIKEEEVTLTKKEYGILEYLIINRGRVVSMDELYEHIWDSDNEYTSNSIKVHLNRLRNKTSYNLIHNKRGEGYYVK